jgi:hypothetical protein
MALAPAESMELQRLLAKAKSRPMPNPDSDGDEFAVYDPHTGLFTNQETGEVMDVWSAAEEQHGGAMTDVSKRRDDQPIPHHPKRVMVPQAKAYSAGAPSQAPALPAHLIPLESCQPSPPECLIWQLGVTPSLSLASTRISI